VLLEFAQRADTRAITMPTQRVTLEPVTTPTSPTRRLGPTLHGQPQTEPFLTPSGSLLNWDMATWALALLALLALAGLIPLWLWVYYAYQLPAP